uniref:Innexin n=1 Tax=Panagrellus redivivus TaxID=6233 RepID=A0A7E4VEU0_PANRE
MRPIFIALTLVAFCVFSIAENDVLTEDDKILAALSHRQCESPDSPIDCKTVDVLLQRPSEADIFRPRRIQTFLLIVVVFSNVCALGALFFHWWNAFVMLFYVYRRLLLLEKKMTTCQERMGKRSFSEQLIGKLAHMANFDFTANQNEADVMLRSMVQ